jgi:hypothetical protein
MPLYDSFGRLIPPTSRLEEKAKQPKHKSERLTQRASGTRKRSVLLPWLLGLCTLVGGLASFVTFWPRPVVYPPTVPFDTGNALSVSFDVSNLSVVPLLDVDVLVGIGQIVATGGSRNRNFRPSFCTRFFIPEWQHHNLYLDDRFTINTADLFPANIAYADIAIVVTYKPWIIPLRREKLFRFVTRRENNGSVRWRSQPIDEVCPANPN